MNIVQTFGFGFFFFISEKLLLNTIECLNCRKFSLCNASKCAAVAALSRSSVNFQLMKNSPSWKKEAYPWKDAFVLFLMYLHQVRTSNAFELKYNLSEGQSGDWDQVVSCPPPLPIILLPSHSLEFCQAQTSNHSQPASFYPEGSCGPSSLVSSCN